MKDKKGNALKATDVVVYKNRPHIIAKIIDGAICLQPLGRAKQFFVNPSQVEKMALFGKSIGDDIYPFMDFEFTDEP